MSITDNYRRLPCVDIVVNRDDRQRKIISTVGIKDSIAKRGVLTPIIITQENVLVAGERRLTASLELGLPDIPCRYVDDLTTTESILIELEENLKRSDLSWQDTAAAVAKLHNIFVKYETNWSQARTAESIGMDVVSVGRYVRLASELGNPLIAKQTSAQTAYNIIQRTDERRSGDAMSEILSASHVEIPTEQGHEPVSSETLEQDDLPFTPPPTPTKPTPTIPILNVDFASWLSTYSGPPFNFLHCDFPYGVGVFDGQMGEVTGEKHYEDTEEIYFALIDTLAQNLNKVLAHSAHVMFWFSMEHYEATLETFRVKMPDIVWQKFPLIWMKSDNVGIMPDPKRGPRRIYETCLIGTRGDRPVVRPVANAYSCPTDRRHHPSTKPEPMLRHFFRMFVDNGTRMLDPTCGGGSALRAAVTMEAEMVLGLEQDPGHFANATQAFKTFQNLRSI